MHQGLLEELLSALMSQAALLQQLMAIDADPGWPQQLTDTHRRIDDVQAALNASRGGDVPAARRSAAGAFLPEVTHVAAQA